MINSTAAEVSEVTRIYQHGELSLGSGYTARLIALVFLFAGAVVAGERVASPLAPRDALAGFQTEPGLRVELAAAEPDVIDPVAMAFDERGRLFVVEARGYPVHLGQGVVALLEDGDGNGRSTRRSTFAAGLRFPTGLLPWKGGLFVTDAPEVLYLEDTDGDGRADSRRVVLTGFATDRSTQLRVNDPTLGLDGWIYLAGGLSGGAVTSPRHPERAPADLKRADLRFHPETGVYDTIDGKSQFGISFDDFGRRFICMNRVQAQHVVISSRLLARNPHFAFSDTVQDLPEERVDDLLKGHNAAARIYPLSDNITTADSHAGTFSAACAVTVWRGGTLPDRLRGQVLSCDPTGNLVHRDELLPDGATFRARRSREKTEFLASPDNWFRPVFLATGPDGALYICDMYRKVIEHPDYLPLEVRKRVDFESGRDRGRIYRVVAAESETASDTKSETSYRTKLLSPDASPDALASQLQSGSSWHRDTAFRLLIERADARFAPALERVLSDTRSAPGRVMAAHVLRHLGKLEPSLLLSLFESQNPGVREVAIGLASPRLRRDGDLARAVISLFNDADPRVRFSCALALGEVESTQNVDGALAEIARRGAGDRWTRAAVISSAPGRESALIGRLVVIPPPTSTGQLNLLLDLARAAGRSTPPEKLPAALFLSLFQESGRDEVWPFALFNGLARSGLRPRALVREQPGVRTISSIRLGNLYRRAMRIASDAEAFPSSRILAVEFLGHGGPDGREQILADLVDPLQSLDLQRAAVRALKRIDTGGGALLGALERWPSWSAAVREVVLAEFLPDRRFASGFLTAVQQGSVAGTSLSVGARKRLLEHKDLDIRRRAEKLFAAAERDRMKVFERYRPASELRGDPEKGRAVFRELCSPCHRLDREGVQLGPDLFGVRNQTKETLLLHVVVPNHEIASGFEATVVVTAEGETLIGMISSETPTSITLRVEGGVEKTLLRDELVSTTVSPVSLMPEGLETSTTLEGMADLLAYLRGEGATE